jgi:hypothetical protein
MLRALAVSDGVVLEPPDAVESDAAPLDVESLDVAVLAVAFTVICKALLAVLPAESVTVKVTVYVPGVLYVWSAVASEPAVTVTGSPSPNVKVYFVIVVPSAAVEPAASAVTFSGATPCVAVRVRTAVGLDGGGVAVVPPEDGGVEPLRLAGGEPGGPDEPDAEPDLGPDCEPAPVRDAALDGDFAAGLGGRRASGGPGFTGGGSGLSCGGCVGLAGRIGIVTPAAPLA